MAGAMNERLKKLLKIRGMTQRDLANKSGATEASVSHYIKGDRVPASDTLTKLAEALGVTPDYLLFGEPFTGDDKLNDAVNTILKYAEHLSREQKVMMIEAMMFEFE